MPHKLNAQRWEVLVMSLRSLLSVSRRPDLVVTGDEVGLCATEWMLEMQPKENLLELGPKKVTISNFEI